MATLSAPYIRGTVGTSLRGVSPGGPRRSVQEPVGQCQRRRPGVVTRALTSVGPGYRSVVVTGDVYTGSPLNRE